MLKKASLPWAPAPAPSLNQTRVRAGSESAPGRNPRSPSRLKTLKTSKLPDRRWRTWVPLTLLMAAAGAAAIVVGKKSKKED